MSHDRMKEEEQRLKDEFARLQAEAEASDATEDETHGRDGSGNENKIILPTDVTNQANDKRQAVPVVDQALENLEVAGVERHIGATVIDSGYHNEAKTSTLEQRGIDPYIATERLKNSRGNPASAAWSDSQELVRPATDGGKAADQESVRRPSPGCGILTYAPHRGASSNQLSPRGRSETVQLEANPPGDQAMPTSIKRPNFTDFAQKVRFRLLQPHTITPISVRR
jgi:hypothetical protein